MPAVPKHNQGQEGPVIPPLSIVVTDTFKAGLAAQLARGGDICFHADSIGSGKGAAFTESEQFLLRRLLLDKFQNAGYESGYGYFSVGDPWDCASGTPTYFHKGGFTGAPFSNNYMNMISVHANGANSQCRFSFPPSIYGRKIKKVELVLFTYNVTNPTYTVDLYSVASPLSSGDAYITAGTASSITHSGLTGVSQTITPGNITNATAYRTGVLNISFDGVNHNPVVQVTTSDDVEVCGVILYCDDWEYEGKGVRFHDFSVSGRQLLPTRSTHTPGSPDKYAYTNANFLSWFRSWQLRIGTYGLSNSYVTNGPCCNTKLMILGLGVNDELLNGSTPSAYAAYCIDTVDAILDANPQTYILIRQPYCPGNICESWRKGYDPGLSGSKISPAINFTAYWSWIYVAQAKYPDRVAVISYDRLLGEKSYSEAITTKGWSTVDNIHWKNSGPSWGVSQTAKTLPEKSYFALSTGIKADSLSASCTQAVRFDRFENVPNWGSIGGTWSAQTGAGYPGNRASRTSDGLSFTMNITTNNDGYGFQFSDNIAPPQGNYTLLIRFFLASSPPSGQSYICSLYGDEGGTAANWQLRLGSGTAGNALKLDGVSTSPVVIGAWNTVIKTRNGTSVTYYLNGTIAGTGTESIPANTAGYRKMATVTTGPGRPLTPGSKVSHAIEWSRVLSASEISAISANPDLIFNFA